MDFLNTVEGELVFFRSIMRYRPVGIHRHFHVMAMSKDIFNETQQHVSIDALWTKLQSVYDLDALEQIVRSSSLSLMGAK